MKAAYIKKTGSPDVIEWGELPVPEPKEKQVLVKVTAVAVDPIDTYFRSGKYTPAPSLPFPFIIGRDLVGVVEKKGRGATQFKEGERVWSNSMGIDGRQGSFAQYAVVDEHLLYPAPANVDDKDLVAVLHSGATACMGLIREAMLKSSETLFVNGGSGNIGSSVIQLAKGRGARVIATASGDDKCEWCKGLGADLVLDYHRDDLEQEVKKLFPEGVDVFWDTSNNPHFDLAVSLLGRRGRIILMAGAEARPPFPVGPFYRKECTMRGFTIHLATAAELHQYADVINLCVEQGGLKAKIAVVMPLSEASKAHVMMEAKTEVWGKIVLTVT